MKHGQLALVTGALGAIGREVVKRLDAQGYELILVDRNAAELSELSQLCRHAQAIVVDQTDQQSVSQLAARIRDDLGHVNLAFINAGVVIVGDLLDADEVDIDVQLDVNLRSAIHLIKACAHNMAEAGSGHIIATVSMGGIVALKGSATYAASKFGLRGFLTSIRGELRSKNVQVSGIFPSGVDTAMLQYEAINGGSPLNFVNTPQTVQAVGDVFERAIKGRKLEYYLPYSDSVSGRIVSCFPWCIRYLEPVMEWLGERGRKKYLARLQANQSGAKSEGARS